MYDSKASQRTSCFRVSIATNTTLRSHCHTLCLTFSVFDTAFYRSLSGSIVWNDSSEIIVFFRATTQFTFCFSYEALSQLYNKNIIILICFVVKILHIFFSLICWLSFVRNEFDINSVCFVFVYLNGYMSYYNFYLSFLRLRSGNRKWLVYKRSWFSWFIFECQHTHVYTWFKPIWVWVINRKFRRMLFLILLHSTISSFKKIAIILLL